MKALVKSVLIASLVSLNIATASAATTYQFTATALGGGGGEISGSFVYDPTVAAVVNDGGIPGTFYGSAMTNLQGSWQGQSFHDSVGFAGVWNDSLVEFPLNNVDLLQLTADAPTGGDLVGFQKVIGGVTRELVNVRIFWIEDNSGTFGPIVGDFLHDELLPTTLPPMGDSFGARLALDFANINNPSDIHYEIGFGLQVTAVPLPASIWMMLMAFGTLVTVKVRRRNA